MMLLEEIKEISAAWEAWLVVGLLSLVALRSVVCWARCSRIVAQDSVSVEEAQAYLSSRHISSPRFAVAMLGGFAASVAGLVMLSFGIKPAIALLLLASGIFLIQTEPVRLSVKESELRVIAAEARSDEAAAAAMDRLQSDHLRLITINVGIVAAFAAALLAF